MEGLKIKMNRVYLSPPDLDGEEKRLLLDAFDSNWITTLGPQVDAFERDVCERTGIPYATALSSDLVLRPCTLLFYLSE